MGFYFSAGADVTASKREGSNKDEECVAGTEILDPHELD